MWGTEMNGQSEKETERDSERQKKRQRHRDCHVGRTTNRNKKQTATWRATKTK